MQTSENDLIFTDCEHGKIVGYHDERKLAFKSENNYPLDVIIPKKVDSSIVIEIGCYSFSETNILSIFIPNTIISLQNYAFHKCYKLKKIDFEKDSKVMNVGYGVFSYLSVIERIDLPKTVINMVAENLQREFVYDPNLVCISYLGDVSFQNNYLIQHYNPNLKIHLLPTYTGVFGNESFNGFIKDGRPCDLSLRERGCTIYKSRYLQMPIIQSLLFIAILY